MAPVPIRIYSRVRPSVIAAELQRIRDSPRRSNISYVSKYLNSKENILFDDETREIRARADSLLRRIHVYVPRPSSSDFAEVIIPERMRSDDYLRRVLTARKNTKKDKPVNHYESPDTRHFGHGNLASITYTGGKPHSRRRPYYKLDDLRAANIQNDVNLLSFYAKNRQAAASAYPDFPFTERELRKVRALTDDQVHVPLKEASPDPELMYKLDLAAACKSEEIAERESKKIDKTDKKPRVQHTVVREHNIVPVTVPQSEVPLEIDEKSESILSFVTEPEHEAIIEPQLMPTVDPGSMSLVGVKSGLEPIVETKLKPIVKLESELATLLMTKSELIHESESELTGAESRLAGVVQVGGEMTIIKEKQGTFEDTYEGAQNDIVMNNFEPEDLAELETDGESAVVPISTGDFVIECSNNELNDGNQQNNEVLQHKLDDEELRRQVEELKRQAAEEKRRQAEEARLTEERYKAEIEERVRIEEIARQTRLREIEEQERLEAERHTEEIRIETERLRDLKIAEEQKNAAEYETALAFEAEERYIIEKAAEDARKRQEHEEILASEVVGVENEEDSALESAFDECQCHDNVKFQVHEERPDSPDADDDTHIEEEAICISTDCDELNDRTYDGEYEGLNSVQVLDLPAENIPQVEETSLDVEQ